MTPAAGDRVLVLDASVLINLLHVRRLDLLGRLQGWRFCVPEEVCREVLRPEQEKLLAEAIVLTWLFKITLDPDEMQEADALRKRHGLGRGESACLALAARRGWLIACDEAGKFPRLVEASLGADRLLVSADIVLLAIRRGLLDLGVADRFLRAWADNRYEVAFRSFAELLPQPPADERVGEAVLVWR
ncbi:MAG: hypothetical protein EYC70_05270 [Planctomycetota bacterium]|nr:MAG: hypothetical protein EYC70_05270 [Planctomycetota bacterium]